MTIDEAIVHAREVSSRKFDDMVHCIRCSEFHEQLAEWLEELKELRKIKEDYSKGMQSSYAIYMYNKAIDDFVTKISESNQGHWRPTQYEHGEVVSETMSYDIGTIKEIAEQLKGCNNNGE